MLANDPIKSTIRKTLHKPQFVVCRANRVKTFHETNMNLKRNLIMTRRVVWYTTRLHHLRGFGVKFWGNWSKMGKIWGNRLISFSRRWTES